MTIDSIQNGYVLDHIPAGMGMRIYKLLGLDKTDAQVALIQNAKSSKMGKKDVLKIATDKFDLNLDAVAYLAPHTTVNVICSGKAAEKQALRLPRCRAPAAQQVIGLQREGGKCGKPAAKPHLQKQQQRLGIDFMPFTQCGQQPNSKGAQHVDAQGDNGKRRLAHRGTRRL